MRAVRYAFFICVNLLGFAAHAQAVTGIWEGKLEGGPGSLRIDLDNEAALLNGGSALELEIINAEASDLRFNVLAAGQVYRFSGEQVENSIEGSLAAWKVIFTRMPDSTPALTGIKRYPLPITGSDDAKGVIQAHAIVEELMRDMEISGMSVAVARNGIVVYSEGFGKADLEQNVPVTTETLFRAASVSKVLTAAGLAKLVEEGRIDLDASVQKYLPDFPVKQWPVSSRQLAAHTSGIRHYDSKDMKGPLNGNAHFASVQAGLAIFKDDPLLFEPGSQYHYSSYGWNLISAVIEAASGEEFLTYMQRNIFEPMGLDDISADHVYSLIPNRASFYNRADKGRELEHASYIDASYKWASGGFLASTEDLVRFGSQLLQPGFFRQETLNTLFTGHSLIPPGNTTAVGLGWRIGADSDGRRLLHHAGAMEGARSVILMIPDEGIVVAMMSNMLAPFGVMEAYRVGMQFD